MALWLARRAADWVPAPIWAVATPDHGERPRVLSVYGTGAEPLKPTLEAVAALVLRRGSEYAAADLSVEPDVAEDIRGSVIAVPLQAHELVGVLVGLDPTPSASAPTFGPTVGALLRTTLLPVAVALDTALRLERAEALSVTDDLTGLYNARYLNAALRREVKLVARTRQPLSLLFLDLDGFKAVNDRHGHLTGGRALVEVASELKRCARETDIVARFGGDEFAVILPGTATQGAVALGERMRAMFGSRIFLKGEGLSVRLTASIGVATLPDGAVSAEDLLTVADTAMYRVKASGKNGIQVG